MPSATTRPSKQSTTGKARKRTSAGKSNAHSESKHKPRFDATKITEIPSIEAATEKYTEVQGICPECLMIPEMQLQEFRELCRSIAATGLQHDILLTHDGKLIDGRCRLRACLVTGQPPRFRKVAVDQQPLAIALANFSGRKLSAGQRAAFAYRTLLPTLRKFAKARQRLRSKHREHAPAPDANDDQDQGLVDYQSLASLRLAKGSAREQAAALVGCSGKTISDYSRLSEADPEAAELVASGKQRLAKALSQITEPPASDTETTAVETQKTTLLKQIAEPPELEDRPAADPPASAARTQAEPPARAAAKSGTPAAPRIEQVSKAKKKTKPAIPAKVPDNRNSFLDHCLISVIQFSHDKLIVMQLPWLDMPLLLVARDSQYLLYDPTLSSSAEESFTGDLVAASRKALAHEIEHLREDGLLPEQIKQRELWQAQLRALPQPRAARKRSVKKSSKRKPR